MINVFLFILSVVISALAVEVLTRYAVRKNLLDHPNERSSHSQPVPRVGGVGIVLGFLMPFVIGGWGVHLLPQARYAVLLSMAGMACVGLWDDLLSLAPAAKYAMQLAIAGGLVWWGLVARDFTRPHVGTIHLGWPAVALTLLWLTGFPNYFNFMDGINGMAGGTGVIYGGFLAAIAVMEGRPELAILGLLLAGSSLGFLFHNFPTARTFMGDTGSMFLGLGVAMLAVLIHGDTMVPLILCSVFLYDCTATIARRLTRGENIFRAHRSHHYQRLVQSGWSHARVSILYFAMHCVAGGLALVYLRCGDVARWGVLGAVALMLAGLRGLVMWVERPGRAFAGTNARQN
jgi:UDP-N-acetylmuramyl pentapeptide phosphotransferase/UDP-N-acetylglucosamine-1-phosphate transferase